MRLPSTVAAAGTVAEPVMAPAWIVMEDVVVSPFDVSEGATSESTDTATDETLELTIDNVDQVLDGMRPYLMADGGNVAVNSVDGGIVKLELQGACGTAHAATNDHHSSAYVCAISTMRSSGHTARSHM